MLNESLKTYAQNFTVFSAFKKTNENKYIYRKKLKKPSKYFVQMHVNFFFFNWKSNVLYSDKILYFKFLSGHLNNN